MYEKLPQESTFFCLKSLQYQVFPSWANDGAAQKGLLLRSSVWFDLPGSNIYIVQFCEKIHRIENNQLLNN
jgi:hypothetical protein